MNFSNTNWIHKTIILISLIVLCEFANSQILNKNMELTVEVKCIDSEYIMIPQLKIFSKGISINLHKKLLFDNEINPIADCVFILQKRLKKSFINIYRSSLKHPMPDNGYFKFRNYKYGDALSDSINLKYYVPLEVGNYNIMIKLNYYIKGVKKTVYSNLYEFQVDFEPKDSIY